MPDFIEFRECPECGFQWDVGEEGFGPCGGERERREDSCPDLVTVRYVRERPLAAADEAEPSHRFIPADYESYWERRYNEQHRTLHSAEDALAEARATARDFAKALRHCAEDPWNREGRRAANALARHPEYSEEAADEASKGSPRTSQNLEVGEESGT